MGKQAKPRTLSDSEAKSVVRNLRISPQKLNLVAAMIRGMDVNKAMVAPLISEARARKCSAIPSTNRLIA